MATIENQRVEFQFPHRDSVLATESASLRINRHIPEDALTLEALGLYLRMNASFINDTGRRKTQWTTRKISQHCHVTWRRAQRLIRELITMGYIEERVVSRPRKDTIEDKTILIFLDVPKRLVDQPQASAHVRVEGEIPIELVLVDFAQFVIKVGSYDVTFLVDFEFYDLLAERFGSEKLCDFAQLCLREGIPSSKELCDFTQLSEKLCDSAQLSENVDPSPSPLFPPASPPFPSPLDSLSLPPSPSPYSPPSAPPSGSLELDSPQSQNGVARSARDLPAVGQVPAFAGERPEGEARPVLVPSRPKTKRVISTEVKDAGLLAQARMDDLMEQVPEAAAASVPQHPTRDLIATYIEELGFTPPVMGKTLGAAKALTKLKEPCLPEELRQIYRFYKEQSFWKDKMLSLTFLAEHLIQWRMQGRPPAKSELRKAQNKEPESTLYPPISNTRYLEVRRMGMVKQYGEDSEQVKRFDEDLAIERRDTAAGLYEEHGVTDDGEEY
jgi:hypothetical protein